VDLRNFLGLEIDIPLKNPARGKNSAGCVGVIPVNRHQSRDKFDCPYLFRQGQKHPHGKKLKHPLFSVGARNVRANELKTNARAREAMDFEFRRLSGKDTFDWYSVEEASHVRRRVQNTPNLTAHAGFVLEYA